MTEAPSLELLARWRTTGDQQAAAELYGRYVGRLIALARKHLAAALGRRLDPDDIVQSACRSFFVGVREGRLELRVGSDLWQLLAAITLHKVRGQVAYHQAGKRSLRHEQEPHQSDSVCRVPVEAMAPEPTPAEVVALAEERDHALSQFKPLHRRMIELRLQGHTLTEIGAQTGRSERMVRIVLSGFGKQLQRRLLETADA
jgi:RNA polymerase sigma-70 factor (ECF subfamily)